MNGAVYVSPFRAWTFDVGDKREKEPTRVRFATPQGPWRLRRLQLVERSMAPYARTIEVVALICGNRQPIARLAPCEHDVSLRLADLDRARFQTAIHLGEACELALRLAVDVPSEWHTKQIVMIATFDEQPPRKAPARGDVVGGPFFPFRTPGG